MVCCPKSLVFGHVMMLLGWLGLAASSSLLAMLIYFAGCAHITRHWILLLRAMGAPGVSAALPVSLWCATLTWFHVSSPHGMQPQTLLLLSLLVAACAPLLNFSWGIGSSMMDRTSALLARLSPGLCALFNRMLCTLFQFVSIPFGGAPRLHGAVGPNKTLIRATFFVVAWFPALFLMRMSSQMVEIFGIEGALLMALFSSLFLANAFGADTLSVAPEPMSKIKTGLHPDAIFSDGSDPTVPPHSPTQRQVMGLRQQSLALYRLDALRAAKEAAALDKKTRPADGSGSARRL